MPSSDSKNHTTLEVAIRNETNSIGIELPPKLRFDEHVRFSTNGKSNDTAGWYKISKWTDSSVLLQVADRRKKLDKRFVFDDFN